MTGIQDKADLGLSMKSGIKLGMSVLSTSNRSNRNSNLFNCKFLLLLLSHLPTHSVTAYPMVSIRLSDHQRLIQPYLHSYSWLMFSAVALYAADLASGEAVDGEMLDSQVVAHARALQQECVCLIGDCLMKVQQEKGEFGFWNPWSVGGWVDLSPPFHSPTFPSQLPFEKEEGTSSQKSSVAALLLLVSCPLCKCKLIWERRPVSEDWWQWKWVLYVLGLIRKEWKLLNWGWICIVDSAVPKCPLQLIAASWTFPHTHLGSWLFLYSSEHLIFLPPNTGAKSLLCMLPEGESLSENATPSVDYSTDSNVESCTCKESTEGKMATPTSFTHLNVNTSNF